MKGSIGRTVSSNSYTGKISEYTFFLSPPVTARSSSPKNVPGRAPIKDLPAPDFRAAAYRLPRQKTGLLNDSDAYALHLPRQPGRDSAGSRRLSLLPVPHPEAHNILLSLIHI